MADPKAEPQFEASVRKLNALRGEGLFKVERRHYDHPKTGRKMVEFVILAKNVETFSTKDYNRVNDMLKWMIDCMATGVI